MQCVVTRWPIHSTVRKEVSLQKLFHSKEYQNTSLSRCMYPYDIPNASNNDLNVSPVATNMQKMYYLIISVDDCKYRWRNIRDTYMKHKRCSKYGTGSAAQPKTKWALLSSLQFLERVPIERRQVFLKHNVIFKFQQILKTHFIDFITVPTVICNKQKRLKKG